MKLPIKFIVFLIIIIGLVFFNTSHTQVVFASTDKSIIPIDPTPMPTPTLFKATAMPTPTLFKATATVDPSSIGDTSGVIAIGMIVVFIILAGVLWGSLDLRQGSLKTRQPKE